MIDKVGVECVFVGVFISDKSCRVLSCCLLKDAKNDFISPNVPLRNLCPLLLAVVLVVPVVLVVVQHRVVR